VLNTILYNWKEGINNEVKKRQGKSAAANAPRTSIGNNVSAANNDALFDRKIDLITEGIAPYFASKLRELSKTNALTMIDYVLSMKNEINLSDGYRKLNIYALYSISKFFNNRKSCKEFTREDVLQSLDSLRKPEASDPLHKWIGTYNIYRILFVRFFKWLYYPNIEQKKRPKPSVVENIALLKRKEQSIYTQ
jgi:hypothetical protein